MPALLFFGRRFSAVFAPECVSDPGGKKKEAEKTASRKRFATLVAKAALNVGG